MLLKGYPSLARSIQFWADAFNVLTCTANLFLGICISGDEMIRLNERKLSTYLRDIHAKCNQLLICFLLRGAPLKILFQVIIIMFILNFKYYSKNPKFILPYKISNIAFLII
jgi:hypothetical protein